MMGSSIMIAVTDMGVAKREAVWGTLGKGGVEHCSGTCPDHQLTYKKLIDCDTEHLEAILANSRHIRGSHYENIIQSILTDRMRELRETMVFVFGSNEAGIHGAGAALDAERLYGAIAGQGLGRQGNSYGIATKGKSSRGGIGNPLPLDIIQAYVEDFQLYAENTPTENFRVTQIGCGYAGFTSDQLAPFFANCPANCYFDKAWEPWLPGMKFWGTFGD